MIRYRVEEEDNDWIIYVVDSGQSTHLQLCFEAAAKCGFMDPSKVRVDHVNFGVVLARKINKLLCFFFPAENLCSRTLDGLHRHCSLGVVACDRLVMLTCALLVTSSHSEGRR